MTDDNIYTSYTMEQPIYATWPKEKNLWGENNIKQVSLSPPKPPLPPPELPPPRPIPPTIDRAQKPPSLSSVLKKNYIEKHY